MIKIPWNRDKYRLQHPYLCEAILVVSLNFCNVFQAVRVNLKQNFIPFNTILFFARPFLDKFPDNGLDAVKVSCTKQIQVNQKRV